MIIYKVTNKINGKIYIGQTKLSLLERKLNHERESRSKKRTTVYFHNALIKYGFESFEWCEIDTAQTQEELDEKEIYWISYYKSAEKLNGYNLKLGGNGGGKNTKETLKKIGESTKKKWKNPDIAKKMLSGLQKGVETQKLKSENNWKETKCILCGTIIKYRPKDTNSIRPKFCSEECLNSYTSLKSIDNLKLASLKNKENYNRVSLKLIRLVSTWALNKLIILSDNIKFNNLKNTIFSELRKVTKVKDDRTIMKPFGFTSRKLFIEFLLKMYADQV